MAPLDVFDVNKKSKYPEPPRVFCPEIIIAEFAPEYAPEIPFTFDKVYEFMLTF